MKRMITIMTFVGIFLIGGISHAQVQQGTQQNQEEFQSIRENDIPDEVKQAVDEQFKNSEIDEAFVNSNKIYKLKLKSKQNQTEEQNLANEQNQMEERNQNKNVGSQIVYYKEDGTRVSLNENEQNQHPF